MTHLPTVSWLPCKTNVHSKPCEGYGILLVSTTTTLHKTKLSMLSNVRRLAVGTGDRSERIRTYNYPQNRVTDHRIGLSLNKLDRIMNGELGDIIDALIIADQTAKLEELKQG